MARLRLSQNLDLFLTGSVVCPTPLISTVRDLTDMDDEVEVTQITQRPVADNYGKSVLWNGVPVTFTGGFYVADKDTWLEIKNLAEQYIRFFVPAGVPTAVPNKTYGAGSDVSGGTPFEEYTHWYAVTEITAYNNAATGTGAANVSLTLYIA